MRWATGWNAQKEAFWKAVWQSGISVWPCLTSEVRLPRTVVGSPQITSLLFLGVCHTFSPVSTVGAQPPVKQGVAGLDDGGLGILGVRREIEDRDLLGRWGASLGSWSRGLGEACLM